MSVRVVHMTTVHRPFDVRIFHKQCVSLARAGFDVTLIQQGERHETVEGVAIEPIPAYASRWARMSRGVWRATRAALRLKPDVAHFHDAELIWGGLILKLAGIRVIYDVHEDVAKDIEDKAYLPRYARVPLQLAIGALESVVGHVFDRISTATRAINARFPERRRTLIRNTPILGELSVESAQPFDRRPPDIGYFGGLAAFNGPRQMVEAMALLPADLRSTLQLGGRFPDPAIEHAVRALPGWSRVRFHGWVERAEMAALLGEVRCGLVLYQPSPNIVSAEPNKFFEFLSAGVPIVASDFPIWRAFVEEFRCGLCVDPSDPQAIADAIEYLVRHPREAEAMGARGQAAILQTYNWGQDAARLVAMYDELTAGRRGDAGKIVAGA